MTALKFSSKASNLNSIMLDEDIFSAFVTKLRLNGLKNCFFFRQKLAFEVSDQVQLKVFKQFFQTLQKEPQKLNSFPFYFKWKLL